MEFKILFFCYLTFLLYLKLFVNINKKYTHTIYKLYTKYIKNFLIKLIKMKFEIEIIIHLHNSRTY
jgi:hypothetical protein